MKKKNFIFKFVSKYAEMLGRNIFYRIIAPVVFRNKVQEERIDINSVKSILILRTDYVGDLICTTPMFNVIKKLNPNVRLFVALSNKNHEIVEYDTNIDEKVILIKDKKLDRDALKYLKEQNIEVLFNTVKMNTTREGLWLNRISPKGIKVSFFNDKRPYYKSLYNRLLDIGRNVAENLPMPLMTLELLKGTFTNPIKDEWVEEYIVISPKAKEKWTEFSAEKNIEKKKFIVINLSARQRHNQWTREGYESLLRMICGKYPEYPILMSAVGNDDINFAEELERKFPHTYYYKTDSVLDAATMCEDALLAVTPDTGFVHILAAVKCPVVGLYSKHEVRWEPFKVLQSLVVVPGRFLNVIKPEEVYNAFEDLLGKIGVIKL